MPKETLIELVEKEPLVFVLPGGKKLELSSPQRLLFLQSLFQYSDLAIERDDLGNILFPEESNHFRRHEKIANLRNTLNRQLAPEFIIISTKKQNGRVGYYLGNTESKKLQTATLPTQDNTSEHTIPEVPPVNEEEQLPATVELQENATPYESEMPKITDEIPTPPTVFPEASLGDTDDQFIPEETHREKTPILDITRERNAGSPSTTDLYLREVARYPLLTAEQEQELGMRISAKKLSLRNLNALLSMLPLSMPTRIQEVLSQSKNISLLEVLNNDIEDKSEAIKIGEEEMQKLLLQDPTESTTERIEELKKEIEEYRTFLAEVKENDRFINQEIEQFYVIEDDQEREKAVEEFTNHLLLGLIHAGDEAQDLFTKSNLRLVVSIAKRFVRSGSQLSLLDVIQEGNEGLMRAVEKWDFRRGYKFSTFATWWIRQAITRGVAEHNSTIRTPVHAYERLQRLRKKQLEIQQKSGKEIPLEDLIKQEIPLEEQETLLAALRTRRVISLNQPIENDEGSPSEIGDFIPAPENTEEESTSNVFGEDIRKILAETLTQREYLVISQRFGFDGDKKTLDDLGRDLGLTRERVRQIEGRALKKLHASKDLLRQFQGLAGGDELQPSGIIFSPGLKT